MAWAATAAAVAFAVATAAEPHSPRARPLEGSIITRAAFAEGRLWIRTVLATVVSIAPGEAQRREESVPGSPVDLCVVDGHIAVFTLARGRWTLHTRSGDAWTPGLSFDAPVDVLGVHCSPRGVTVATEDRLIVARSGRVRRVKLSDRLPPGLVTGVHLEGDDLYVAFDRGEWGGDLARVRLRDGGVSRVDRRAALDGDESPLAALAPVNGVAPLPWRAGCVAAAVGLAHLSSVHGQLLEICADRARRLLPATEKAPWIPRDEPLYRLCRAGDALLTASAEDLYRVTAQGAVAERLPPFEDIGGIQVSFAVPGVALVLPHVKGATYGGLRVPMLIPMQ